MWCFFFPITNVKAHDPQLSWKYPVGLLTTMNRDEWAVAREELIAAHSVNAGVFFLSCGCLFQEITFFVESIAAIDSAIMVLCLDDEEPQT